MKGRLPKNNKLKVLSGSKHAKKTRKIKNTALFETWECPDFIGGHGEKLWADVGPVLVTSGIMIELDRVCFAMLCQTYDMIIQFEAQVEKDGAIISDARGSEKKHPLLTAISQQTTLFRSLCQEFGMTPSSRSRLGFTIEAVEEDDDVWETFNRKRRERKEQKETEDLPD
jgi:P27 family predicted phage terminase small subunit